MTFPAPVLAAPSLGGPAICEEILNGLDAAVLCYDRDDRLVFWNPAVAIFFPKAADALGPGVPRDELLVAMHSAGYAPARTSHSNAPAIDIEEWHLPDGRRLLRHRVRLGLDRNVMILFDVTDRFAEERRLGEALAAERERFELAIEGSGEGIFDRDVSAGTIWFSARAHEMLGLPDGTLNGSREIYMSLVHPEDRATYEEQAKGNLARRDRLIVTVCRVRHADGGWRRISARARLIYDAGGRPIRATGSIADITDEHEAREELRQAKADLETRVAERTAHLEREIAERRLAEEAVRRSEKRLQEAIDALDDSFSLYDGDNRLVLCNRAFASRAKSFCDDDPRGMTYRQLLELLWDDPRSRPSDRARNDWIGERVEQQRAADGSAYEVNRKSGVFRTRAFRTGAGETVRLTSDVTELRRAEERIRSLLEVLPVGITVHDAEGRAVESNEAWRRIYRVEALSDLGSLSYRDRVQRVGDSFVLEHPDGRAFSTEERERWLATRIEAMQSGVPEAVVRRVSGGRITRVTSVRTADGHLLQAHEDITELRNAERRLVTAVDAISDSFALFDAQQRLVLSNSAYRREFGPIADRIANGMTFREICSICWDAGLILSSEPKSEWIERRLRRQEQATGQPFEVRRGDRCLRVSDYRTFEGEFVRVATDITDLTRAEDEQRRLAAENLRLSEAEIAKRNFLLQAVIETIPDGLVIVQEGQGAVFWNHGFLRIAGLSTTVDSNIAGPLRNRGIRELLDPVGLDPESLDGLVAGRIAHLEHTCAGGRSFEIRILDSGEGSRLLWIADTTGRRAEEAERLALKERVLQAQKSEAIGAVAGTIAHDFNNLLTITLGFAALGQAQLDVLASLPTQLGSADPAIARTASYIANASVSLKKSLGNIVSAADRGKVVVENLMHYSRGRPAALANADLSKTIETSAALIATSLPSSVGFSVNPAGRVLPVRHDPVKIEQVLLNLCINSSHALDGRAGKMRIDIAPIETDGGRASALTAHQLGTTSKAGLGKVDALGWAHRWRGVLPQGRYVKIDVVDNGNGMTPEILEKIFDPFFTTKSEGKGTGLGIPSVDQIVAEHGGAIHVRSKAGSGTVFSVLLPMTEEGPGLEPRRGELERENAGGEVAGGKGGASAPREAAEAEAVPGVAKATILVVDDEKHLTELAAMALERAGYEVDAFTDPLAALGRFQEEPGRYDFVMTDQTMPGMTGMTLAAKIVDARPGLPVLLCTGFSALAIDETKLPTGVIGVLRKPFTPKELVRIVGEAVGKQDGR